MEPPTWFWEWMDTLPPIDRVVYEALYEEDEDPSEECGMEPPKGGLQNQ